ncbi:MAG: ABC transporter permease subunit [Defluviitaleaceae bacterium]|nr:ABC transporter permease subunit [Defluviitaleaceae bacterium]
MEAEKRSLKDIRRSTRRLAKAERKAERRPGLGSSVPLSVNLRKNFALYTMVLPGFVILLLFNYLPMYGIIMAFQDFRPMLGFTGSPWAGLRHFERIIGDPLFHRAFMNSVRLGILSLLISFPAPLVFALLLNEIRHAKFKRVVQTISYMPFFLSTVIIIGLLRDMLSYSGGAINIILESIGLSRIDFFMRADLFRGIFIGTGLWQSIGFGSILYLAAIAGVNPELYESARIDGANRLRMAFNITIPGIMPTFVILFILNIGTLLNNDWNTILLMYNPAIFSTADVVGTYVFRSGIEGTTQSYAAAVGLSMSIISVVMLTIANYVARWVGETSLW